MNFLTTESTEDTEKEEESGSLYPNNLKNWVFGCAKAPGIDDRKSVHISNIDRLTIVDSRELSRGPKPNFSGCLGITGKIIGAAIDIHRALGPGLLESAYEAPRGVHEPMDERSIRKGVPTHPIPSLEFEGGNF